MACGCEGAKCGLEPGDERHGTMNGYSHRKCRCDTCREAQREHYEANREAVLERVKAHYDANHKAIRERKKAYRAANQEAIRERKKAYYDANKEAVREYMKACYAANPDVYREREARRRARKASAFIGPAFTRQQVWDRDNGICHICNQPANPLDWHLEHVIPLARGGAHSFEGCAVSHPACNLRKGTRLLDELDAGCSMGTVSN